MGFFTRTKARAASPSDDSDPEKHYPHATTTTTTTADGAQPVLDDDLPVPALDGTSERALLAKIDLRVVPVLTVLYLLAFLDRVNIANANVFGLSSDLRLRGNEYNTALVIFFVPYCLFEIPGNMLLKKLSPHVWLSACMFLFGLVTMAQGFVRSYGGLLAARFFLGLAETGMFPGCFYLIGMWYRRREAQRRMTFFFSSATLAGAFGGLLAAAIGKMDGLRGYAGWRWVFILEGTLTMVVALACFFLISDFPEQAAWLSPAERAYVRARLAADAGRSAFERRTTPSDVRAFFARDAKAYLGGLMYFGLIVPAYGYAYFSPGIIKGYGYGAIATQLHSVPPWAAAWGLAMLVAFASDRAGHRFAFAVGTTLVAIAGFAMLLAIRHDTRAEYAALFLCAAGTYSALPLAICWYQQNLGGHARRAIGSAWQIGFGNTGGIIAVFAFLARDAPAYVPGYSISVAFCVLSLLASCVYAGAVVAQNRARDRMPRRVGEEALREQVEMGDLASSYRYML